ncbi:MAG: ATP-dependent helicase [Deltaproteobacteria bacterium]|nr:ATP-dependent helicase [Deltaproteobacteria bacterium]
MRPEQKHINYKQELNSSQLEAVMFDTGPLLVIAGAGSGKTRTLTYRVARLVEAGVPPATILLLTFTRKASAEMLSRACRLLDDRCEKVSGGTFHSFGNAILRRYAAVCGFESGFSIMDRADAESLIGMIRKDIVLSAKIRTFPRNQTLASIFSRAVNKGASVDEVVFKDYPHFTDAANDMTTLFNLYSERKRQLNLLDYDDLLVFLHRLLRDRADIRHNISSTYRYIMVDEYQDTNHLQAEILYYLADRNRNVMAVGDDSQSIYAFRGANFKNIIDFPQIFPGAKIIGLEENYRSVQPILSLTNAVIDRATEKYDKKLFTRRKGGRRPCLVDTANENNQSRYVIDKIREIMVTGVPLNQIAVLFRASFHSFDLEIELTREQMPYVKVGGFKFMESAHIKDMLAHLRVVLNPEDRISWHRLLLLLENIGPKSAHDIYTAVSAQHSITAGIMTAVSGRKKKAGLERLAELYAAIDARTLTVAEMGETVLAYYLPILKRRYDDHPKRQKDLEQLLTIMIRYAGLDDFLTDMALEPPSASVEGNLSPGASDGNRMVLSTIHSAKGLEWHTVFIIWAVDGRFPSVRALDNPAELEEELRLMYVAATRARENLFITYPSQVFDRGTGLYFGRPSRFVDRLPQAIIAHASVSPW